MEDKKIKCKHCGFENSLFVEKCIYCGKDIVYVENKKSNNYIVYYVIGAIFLIIIALILFCIVFK